MSLRSKILLILSAVVLVYAGLDHALQEVVVFRNFGLLEADGAERDAQRVVQAVQNEIRHLDAVAAECARREEVRRLLADPAGTAAEGFHARELDRSDLGFFLAVRSDGTVAALVIAPDGGPGGNMLDPRRAIDRARLEEEFRKEAPFLAGTGRSSGVFVVDGEPILLSRKIVTDRDEVPESTVRGKAIGRIVLGRFLDDRLQADLTLQTGIDFDVWPLQSPGLPAEERALLESVADSSGPIVRASGGETLHAYTMLLDLGEAPSLLLRANLPRDITGRGAAAVRYGLLSTLAAGLLLMLVLLALLQRTVLNPIAALTQHAVAIGRGEDPPSPPALARDDEIGILSREFSGMMEKLAKSRAALVETARAAGMSEIATGVLHNVGNALNSVNTSAALIAERTGSTASEDLRSALHAVKSAAGDLATFLASDPRGPHLLPLLVALADQIVEERSGIEQEVRSLTEGIDHIQSLIQTQQSAAGRAGILETIDLREPIDTAVGMTAPGGRPDARIEIVRDYEDLPPAAVDRHRLMEILVNLVQNARQSIQEKSAASPRLTLRLRRRGDEGVRIEVEDNGVGIPAENLARVFTHGFTTRTNGHGFGLHASANAATEMGGVLRARSDGPGRGATFELDLPLPSGTPAEVRA